MNDEQKRLDDAINKALDDYKKSDAMREYAQAIIAAMSDYEDAEKAFWSNLPKSRRERRRMEKAERQKALKARKRK